MDAFWLPSLLGEVDALRSASNTFTGEELLQRLQAILHEARERSGLTRIGFDNKVKNLGINVVSLQVHGSAAALAKAIQSGADASAKGHHTKLPKEVKTACLIDRASQNS
jgi:hypothetical protein